MPKKWILALLIAAPASALAQAPVKGWYIGADVGQADFAGENDTAFKLLGGYRVNRHLAVEGAYASLFDKAGAEATGFELVALGSFSLANQLSLFGKLGFANAYIEAGAIDEEKVELTYGIGLQYDITRNIGVRGQWQRYDTSEEIEVFTLGAVWTF
jgi:opacity protein-like surface antigen